MVQLGLLSEKAGGWCFNPRCGQSSFDWATKVREREVGLRKRSKRGAGDSAVGYK